MIIIIVIEANRIWFIRLKDYLINRYNKAKKTSQGISIITIILIFSN